MNMPTVTKESSSAWNGRARFFFRGQDDYDFAAEGDHGKLGYVSPAKNLIIVRNRLESGYDWSWSDRIKMTYDAVNSVDSARDF